MHVKESRRYPVTSMRGEALDEAEIALDGITGDRPLRVEGARDSATPSVS